MMLSRSANIHTELFFLGAPYLAPFEPVLDRQLCVEEIELQATSASFSRISTLRKRDWKVLSWACLNPSQLKIPQS